jgi:23S rRNA (uridine2552-2'-O)-methyltransferase
MSGKDHWYNKAKQEGYRSRAAYKLKQLDEAASLIDRGHVVVDLGAAPGGWLEVAAELAGPDGRVLGVDRQRIAPIDGVETLQGDLTEEATQAAIRERVGHADLVLSDMSPDMTGEYELDHARSVHLARQALEVAEQILSGGGDLAVKVFQGPDLESLRADVEAEFDHGRLVTPEATRDASSEVYLVGKGWLTAPVRAGDEIEVTVEAVGDEGDGVAKVEGYTVFVPDTAEGETVAVRITDVKPRFGFAEPITE